MRCMRAWDVLLLRPHAHTHTRTHALTAFMSIFQSDLLAGKTALITGGGSGLGLTMTRKYLELGARVIIVGRSDDRLADAAAQLKAGDRLLTFSCDVRE